MWTGDDSGSMDYVKWQIPTFVGCGFSAQAHTSGDIDGIFGGSPESQVRDLQFKALTTTIMVMSGWAGNPDKQPWTWGEPYTTYNRASLKLKAALTPYIAGVPLLTQMQIRFGGPNTLTAPQVYRIMLVDATVPTALVLTLDRVVAEPTNAPLGRPEPPNAGPV
jgi:hypothetical protein